MDKNNSSLLKNFGRPCGYIAAFFAAASVILTLQGAGVIRSAIATAITFVFFTIYFLYTKSSQYVEDRPTHLFTCSQGIVAYKIMPQFSLIHFRTALPEDIDSKLAEAFASNHSFDPKKYEQALHIKIVRYDRTKDTFAPTQDIDAGDLN